MAPDDFLRDASLSDELKIAMLAEKRQQEEFSKTSKQERRQWLYSTPLMVALAGGLTIGFNYLADSRREDQKSIAAAQQSAKQFQYSILEKELEKERSAEERAQVLLFLARTGVLDDLNVDYLISIAEDQPDAIPQLGRIDPSQETNKLAVIKDEESIIDVILGFEGGYADHTSDPADAINMGISLQALSDWRGIAATREDLKALTREDAQAFYGDWIDKSGAGALDNVYLKAVYVNTAVNMGARRARNLLQALIGAPKGQEPSPADFTIANTMAEQSERDTVLRYNCHALAYYKSLAFWDTFARGWTRRLEQITPGGDLSGCESLLGETPR